LLSFAFDLAPCLYELFRLDAKLRRNIHEIRLVRLEESDEGREQRRLAGAAAKLGRPDSGQIEEPLRPPVLSKRCRERGERQSVRVVVTFICHGLE
jgi:hypothetical protein